MYIKYEEIWMISNLILKESENIINNRINKLFKLLLLEIWIIVRNNINNIGSSLIDDTHNLFLIRVYQLIHFRHFFLLLDFKQFIQQFLIAFYIIVHATSIIITHVINTQVNVIIAHLL
jgi:hypothetical protein